jgi:hypothetical protein
MQQGNKPTPLKSDGCEKPDASLSYLPESKPSELRPETRIGSEAWHAEAAHGLVVLVEQIFHAHL